MKTLPIFLLVSVLSGCSSLYYPVPSNSYNDMQVEFNQYQATFNEFYNSQEVRKEWIGKSLSELYGKFNDKGHQRVLDVNNDGWVSYASLNNDRDCVVFYVRNGIIYNVVTM